MYILNYKAMPGNTIFQLVSHPNIPSRSQVKSSTEWTMIKMMTWQENQVSLVSMIEATRHINMTVLGIGDCCNVDY